MSNYTFLPPNVANCFDAQTYLGSANEYGNGNLDIDVGGAVTACSSIAINILLPFLIVWSTDVTPSIFLFMSQAIPVLVATLSSIHSNNLSLFDAHFAAAVTASPIAIYIVASSLRYPFCSQEPLLFTKIPSREAKILVFIMGGLVFPSLWLSVSLITSFSSTAFRNSFYCKGMTLPRYIEFVFASSFTGVLDVLGRRDLWDDLSKRRGLGFISLIWLLHIAVYLVHHREDIIKECVAPMNSAELKGLSRGIRRWNLVKEYVLLGWRIPMVSWDIIISEHPSMLVWLIFCLHWSWTLGISNALTFDRNQLSIFVPVPALWSFCRIVRDSRNKVKNHLVSIPSYIWQGLCFTFTGRNEWSTTEVVKRDYFYWTKRRWVVTVFACFAYMGLHAVWITFYVQAGSMPNNRNAVNEPHKNWKPYSICMFINGYVCSTVGIFLTVAFFDFLPRWYDIKPIFPAALDLTYDVPPFNLQEVRRTRRGEMRLSYKRSMLRAAAFASLLVLAAVLCAGPVFVPYLALPLAQEWHWKHDCDAFPVEIILQGQSKPSEAAFASIFVARTGNANDHYYPQRLKMYDFKFYPPDPSSSPHVRILEYLEPSQSPFESPTSFIPSPAVKALVLDTARRQFIGCSSPFEGLINTTTGHDSFYTYSKVCTAGSGTFEKRPYLRFSINPPDTGSNSTVYLQAESREWAYPDDAPSLSLRYTGRMNVSSADLAQGHIALRSALTKRNNPTILKVCSNEVDVTLESLGPLSIVLEALNRFSVFISRPRVLSI